MDWDKTHDEHAPPDTEHQAHQKWRKEELKDSNKNRRIICGLKSGDLQAANVTRTYITQTASAISRARLFLPSSPCPREFEGRWQKRQLGGAQLIIMHRQFAFTTMPLRVWRGVAQKGQCFVVMRGFRLTRVPDPGRNTLRTKQTRPNVRFTEGTCTAFEKVKCSQPTPSEIQH